MDEIDRFLHRLQRLTTAAYLPAIYEGFVEADALVQSEDALLGLLRDYAQQLWQNRNLLSMTVEKVALFEEMLHLSPGASQSLDERRQTVADTVNGRFVLNDAKLHEICQALAPGFTVYERTDPQALTLGVFTEEDADDGSLPAVGIVDEIRPTVPQNLALYAGVDASFERGVVVNHANYTALWASLGQVERKADSVSGYMTETADFPFETPRGTISTASNTLVNGGEEYDTIATASNLLSYGGGEQQYMEEITEGKGYLRSSAYQTSNRALAANTEYYLYPEGSDTTVDGDTSYTYTLTGAYTAAGVLVDITGALLTVSGSKLKLVWGSTAANVCYVTYTEGV